MVSKASSKKTPRPQSAAPSPAVAARRERLDDRHAHQAVERFKTSAKGFRCVFSGHFPTRLNEVEALAFHLAQVEAQLPNTVEAIRLARYPGAGRRDPRRMALGLCETLSVLRTHVAGSIAALEKIANGHAKK
jgi:hypothetical protein